VAASSRFSIRRPRLTTRAFYSESGPPRNGLPVAGWLITGSNGDVGLPPRPRSDYGADSTERPRQFGTTRAETPESFGDSKGNVTGFKIGDSDTAASTPPAGDNVLRPLYVDEALHIAEHNRVGPSPARKGRR
jgi:hypothetical protein